MKLQGNCPQRGGSGIAQEEAQARETVPQGASQIPASLADEQVAIGSFKKFISTHKLVSLESGIAEVCIPSLAFSSPFSLKHPGVLD